MSTNDAPDLSTLIGSELPYLRRYARALTGSQSSGDAYALATLEAMLPWEQLACFGSEQLTLEGPFGCGVCSGIFPGTFDPPWLAFPFSAAFLSVDPNARVGPFAMHFAPDGPAQPEHGRILRVVGHFDDPNALGCTVAPGEPHGE